MQKKGQFFLAAALVIVGLLIGLTTVYTSSKKNIEDKTIYDLSKELNYETAELIDSGVFNSMSKEEISNQVQDFSSIYSNLNPDSDILIAYGNAEKLAITAFINRDFGGISIGLGQGHTTKVAEPLFKGKTTLEVVPESTNVEVNVLNSIYTFKLKQGQNFYLIMKKERGDEKIVAQ
jgi:hypothetical protein